VRGDVRELLELLVGPRQVLGGLPQLPLRLGPPPVLRQRVQRIGEIVAQRLEQPLLFGVEGAG